MKTIFFAIFLCIVAGQSSAADRQPLLTVEKYEGGAICTTYDDGYKTIHLDKYVRINSGSKYFDLYWDAMCGNPDVRDVVTIWKAIGELTPDDYSAVNQRLAKLH